ncbi:ribosomal protein S6 kinase beta [Colletotrichum spaethianum]|uniref:Ribosomal protein S6 kinase beta n=1 Tax=Colletotrichum spaethianum TaxID=700344 RepID=A0AA37L8T1_9PEZI|nr:ribosomal protein S6 kinase beta [Colletotrichum spaethianum]GKT42789.1 ribosomal protein S6 kinase beta [Colletotrichum spaethianum]
MVVRIRLARFGRVNQPFYNIVVSQASPSITTAHNVTITDASQGPEIGKRRRIETISSTKLTRKPPTRRTARNSKPIEVIGTYDPVPKQDPYDATTKPHKDIRLDSLRARYWIGVGAQPTETVWRLLSMVRDILSSAFLRCIRHNREMGDGQGSRIAAAWTIKP